jgi:hypothetical protein
MKFGQRTLCICSLAKGFQRTPLPVTACKFVQRRLSRVLKVINHHILLFVALS